MNKTIKMSMKRAEKRDRLVSLIISHPTRHLNRTKVKNRGN